ncbi:type II secretion system protein [Pseudomonas aeruginosa]
MKREQKGFTLIEMILVLGLSSAVSLMLLQNNVLDLEQQKAKSAGRLMHQLNTAIGAWTTANVGAPNQTFTNTNWLKSTACAGGTSAVAYLPCAFPKGDSTDPLPGGEMTISSAVSTTGAAPNRITTVTTTTSPYQLGAGQKRSDLAGLAAFTAAAAGSSFNPSTASTSRKYTSDPTTAIVTMVATNNAGNNAWLRTDGGNQMNSNFRFNTANASTSREIQSVSRVQAIAANTLTIGNQNGAASGYSVVVDASESNTGTLTIQNTNSAANAIDISRGDIRVASGNMSIQGTVTAGGNAVAQSFVDINDGNYYATPDATSVLNNVVVRNDIRTPILYDMDNTGYYSIPSGTTRIGKYTTNYQTVNGQTQINGNYLVGERIGFQGVADTEGWGCTIPGGISINSQGFLLTCVGGVWARPMTTYPALYGSVRSNASGSNVQYIGNHRICSIGGQSSTTTASDGYCRITTDGAGNWWLDENITTANPSEHRCYAICNTN